MKSEERCGGYHPTHSGHQSPNLRYELGEPAGGHTDGGIRILTISKHGLCLPFLQTFPLVVSCLVLSRLSFDFLFSFLFLSHFFLLFVILPPSFRGAVSLCLSLFPVEFRMCVACGHPHPILSLICPLFPVEFRMCVVCCHPHPSQHIQGASLHTSRGHTGGKSSLVIHASNESLSVYMMEFIFLFSTLLLL